MAMFNSYVAMLNNQRVTVDMDLSKNAPQKPRNDHHWENHDLYVKHNSSIMVAQMLHGAGICTYLYLKHDPVL